MCSTQNLIYPLVITIYDISEHNRYWMPLTLIDQPDVVGPVWIPGELYSSSEQLADALECMSDALAEQSGKLNGTPATAANYTTAWQSAIECAIAPEYLAGSPAAAMVNSMRFKLAETLSQSDYDKLVDRYGSTVTIQPVNKQSSHSGTHYSVWVLFDFSSRRQTETYFDIRDVYGLQSDFMAIQDIDSEILDALMASNLIKKPGSVVISRPGTENLNGEVHET